MDQDLQNLQKKLDEQGIKLDAIYKSVEKTRKYFLVMTWITIIAIALPLIGLMFTLPTLFNSYGSALNGLGN